MPHPDALDGVPLCVDCNPYCCIQIADLKAPRTLTVDNEQLERLDTINYKYKSSWCLRSSALAQHTLRPDLHEFLKLDCTVQATWH